MSGRKIQADFRGRLNWVDSDLNSGDLRKQVTFLVEKVVFKIRKMPVQM